MDSQWYSLPSVLWSSHLFPCLQPHISPLRLINRRTKLTIDKAISEYTALLRHRLSHIHPFDHIRTAISSHHSHALSILLQLQHSSRLAALLQREPSQDLREIADFMYKLGHPEEKLKKGWPEARWQLANLSLFIPQLMNFDGKLSQEAVFLVEKLTEPIKDREIRLLFEFICDYNAVNQLKTEEFVEREREFEETSRLFTVILKLKSLVG